MKKETYCKMTRPFRKAPRRARVLHSINNLLTALVFAAYPCLLAGLFVMRDTRLAAAICVPLDGFVIVSVVRAWIDRPRPYETFGLPPVFPKETKGHSMPSRHVFSAAVIAFTFFPFSLPCGIALLVCALLLAVIRVIAGVHYLSDVVVGFLAAAAFSIAYLHF